MVEERITKFDERTAQPSRFLKNSSDFIQQYRKFVCGYLWSSNLEYAQTTSSVDGVSSFLLSIYDRNESIDFVHGKSNFFIEVLDVLELFIDKKVIFDEKKIPSVCRLSANFVIRITFSFQPRHFSFSG
jgi:hypothetical protein